MRDEEESKEPTAEEWKGWIDSRNPSDNLNFRRKHQ